MDPMSNTPDGTPTSDITWPSLESVTSPHTTRPEAATLPDVTWPSLDTISSQEGGSVLDRLDAQSSRLSPFSVDRATVPLESPLLGQVPSHRGDPSHRSQSRQPHQKRLLEEADPSTPPKKSRLLTPSPLGSPFSFKASPSSLHESPSSSVEAPMTPTGMGLVRSPPRRSVSSTSSGRKARPQPGSPLWQHMAMLRLSRQNTPIRVSPAASKQPTPSPIHHSGSVPIVDLLPHVPSSPISEIAPEGAPSHHGSLSAPHTMPRQGSGPPITPQRSPALGVNELLIANLPPTVEAHTTSDIAETSPVSRRRKDLSNPLPPNVKAHLVQLEGYFHSAPSLSTLVQDTSLESFVDDPGHPLFQQVFLSSLMHAFYRPQDPEQRLLVLQDPPERTHIWETQLDFAVNPPTHIVGLCTVPDEDLTLLVWGSCTDNGAEFKMQLTIYDSQGRLHNTDLLRPYLEPVHDLFRRSLPLIHSGNTTLRCTPPAWKDELLGLSKRELGLYFCQLISKVVHDLPCNKALLKRGPPVHPRWPPDTVEQKVSELLGQLLKNELRLENVLNGRGAVPECIYLHGERLELLDTDIEDWDEDLDDDTYNEEDQGEEYEQSVAGTNSPNSQLTGKATIENLGKSNWYVKVADRISYRDTTPTDKSATLTPPARSPSPTVSQELTNRRRELVQEIHEDLFNRPCARHISRLAFWQQLKASNFTIELIAFISLHLWLTSLFTQPNYSTLYLEHALVEKLVLAYEDDPQDMEPNHFSELLDRQILWPVMGRKMHVLALLQASEVMGRGVKNWVLMDMTVENCRLVGMDVLLPPHEAFDSGMFSSLGTALIGALCCIFPDRDLIEHSSTVPQTLRSFVLPQPHTDDAVALVMLAHLCGKLLDQPVETVDLGAFRQSLCYYYSNSLRGSEVDSSFPWQGLTDSDGNLLTDKSNDKVRKRRLSLAVNRETSPFGVFPRTQSFTTTISSPGPSAPFFIELAQPRTSHPEGILVGTSGRSERGFEKGTFIGPYPSFRRTFPDRKLQTPQAVSPDELVDVIHSAGGPEHPDAQRLLLTMTHEGNRVTLDWLRGALYPDREWLMAGWDVDSLTATFFNVPKLLEPGYYFPYPSRELSLRFRNELRVRFQGKVIDMHSCPNICFMTLGGNGQFRLLVFFPGKREPRRRRWRNIPTEDEFEDWYHLFLEALHIVAQRAPENWQHALEKTLEALPTCYDMGKKLSLQSGQARSFINRRIEPEIMNQIFPVMRALVDSTARYAKYRGYFFHLCGINLKLATQHIHGREDANPLNYAFRINSFIDWTALNPADIVADVGLAVNMHRRSAPEDFKRSTLLIRYHPLREFLQLGYREPQRDSYLHSHVIAGERAVANAEAQKGGVIKFQAYHKDMVLTYRDREHSVGSNFTVDEALGLGKRDKFDSQIDGFQENVGKSGSYGVRFELRLSAWAANRLMKTNPRDILDQMIEREVIVCHPTETVAALKITLSQTWAAVVRRQRELPLSSRRSPEVMLLTSALCYFLKGLVKRPDEMSPSREMVDRLALVEGARRHGLPYFRLNRLEEDGLRVVHRVDAQSFKILLHTAVIIPGGLWIKSSRTTRPAAPPPHLPSPPTTPHAPPDQDAVWTTSSENFVNDLITRRLPRAMWSFFPENRKVTGSLANSLRKEPLKQKHWSKVVEPLNLLLAVKGDYMNTFERLFPVDWTATAGSGDFKKYDREFLQRVRDHIDAKPVSQWQAYSGELRRKIRVAVLARYDYLPASQAHLMWAYKPGPQGQRFYRVYKQVS